MPEVSRFYGIIVLFHFNEHAPPHFHVRYAEDEAQIEINPIRLREGGLSRRAPGLAMEWAALHQEELAANWERVISGPLPEKIEPLDQWDGPSRGKSWSQVLNIWVTSRSS